ncbi:MAG: M15 family metallopeptidase [Melioribacteraceae bacterium]|nr:M15 family metallopeptidase [Melioribacteraceae bacterium]
MKKLLLLLFLPICVFAQVGEDELVNPKDIIHDVVIDLRYSTTEHKFLNLPEGDMPLPKFYTANECLMVLKGVLQLKIAQDSLRNIREHNGKTYPNGIGIKIWDGYRPRAVQYLFWDIYPNGAFIANPASGSKHNRGGAVDLTLIDLATSEELVMPTAFDDFSNRASHTFSGSLLTQEQVANRKLIKDIMVNVAGMGWYSAEWWHYEVAGANSLPLLDFQMK